MGADSFRAVGCAGGHRAPTALRTARRNSQSKALAPESGRAVGVASWQASVFYEVAPGEPSLVRILAVGKKERNILRVAGREVRL